MSHHTHTEQSPSWKTKSSTASQEISCILCKPKVYSSINKHPPPVLFLNQREPIHTPTSQFSKIHFNSSLPSILRYFIFFVYTGYTKKNGAASKVNKKFISHLTRAQLSPSAAATVKVSHALPAVRFSCLLRGQFTRWFGSRKRLSVCSVLRCPDLWLQGSVSFVHCNHRSGHLKTEHTENLFLLRRHFGNWPRSKHEKRTAGSVWETWIVAAADGVRCTRVRWEINFLLTFESAPFFCVYPVYTNL